MGLENHGRVQGRTEKYLPLIFCLSCQWPPPGQSYPWRSLFELVLSQGFAQSVTQWELAPDAGAMSSVIGKKPFLAVLA